MRRSSVRVRERILDLAWSLWAELGVSGWRRHHTSHAIDPEPLIIFTAWLGDADPRLRDESTDWCIRYGRFVSGTRLKNLLAGDPGDRRASFGRYAATVAAHSPFRWPFATQPRRYRPTGRSRIEHLERPSLIALRLRSLFGVTARAEIIRVLLANPAVAMNAADLAPDTGYTKRNVAEALDALRLAGVVEAMPWRNQLRYRLVKADQVLALAGEPPESFPRWQPIFRVLTRILATARTIETLSATVRFVEIDKSVRAMTNDLQAAGLSGPTRKQPGKEIEPVFWRWAVDLTDSLASGTASVKSDPRVAMTTSSRRRA